MKMKTHSKSSSAMPARQRILEAACAAFAQNSYDTVGMRDIAAQAEADVAYVHRSFGSKLGLFTEAFRTAIRTDIAVLLECDDLAETMADMLMAQRKASPGELGAGLNILLHSIGSADAIEALRSVAVTEFLEPLRERLDSGGHESVVLLGAFLAGLGITFQVLDFDAQERTDRETLKRRVVSILQSIAKGETA